jgi:DNA-binding transcriptional regulator/RsmH inhibitor MraZ
MGIAPGSTVRRQAARAPYGLEIDGEGRAILAGTPRVHARIRDAAAVGGRGQKFQIWESGRFGERVAGATARARAQTKRPGFERAAVGTLGARE